MKQPSALIIFLVAALLIGLLTFTHYGESWDELKLYDYATNSQEAYSTWSQHGTIPVTGDRFENYGPFFVMLTRTIAKTAAQHSTLLQVDVQHLVYFITFLVGMWAFHELATRWMSRNAALGATLLFTTQPLFWGHAFINPKDIPLLTFFLLTVLLGLRMHDTIFEQGSQKGFPATVAAWNQLPVTQRRLLLGASVLWLLSLVLLFGGTPIIRQWIESMVRAAAIGEMEWLARLVPRIQRLGPESYFEKFFVLFLRLRAFYVLLLTLLMLWLYRRDFPAAPRLLAIILPAGIVLGLAISIRIFGVWAGVLVAGYMLWRSGKDGWLVLAVYALVAIIAMYLTWPYLWPDPFGHFLETVQIMSQHPWPGSVLFNGAVYRANALPASYVPMLLAIQLTEPVWALSLVGLAVAGYGAARKRQGTRELLLLTLIWFVVPLITFVIVRPTLYDNFRQAFFIVPPVFFLTGLAFELLRRPLVQAAAVAVVILPGLIASINLHPYEYVYYNQLIGGVDAVADRFELEYWGTSYRELAAEANRLAPPNANVWVDGPAHLFSRFARPDFHIYSPQEAERADHYEVVVTLVRYDWEKTSFPEAEIVYRVTREGAVFAILRTP